MTKSQLLAELADVKRELAERRRVGGMLSNIAFNLHQRAKFGPVTLADRDVASLDETRREWDAIARAEDAEDGQ